MHDASFYGSSTQQTKHPVAAQGVLQRLCTGRIQVDIGKLVTELVQP